jgi:hypothetical protein
LIKRHFYKRNQGCNKISYLSDFVASSIVIVGSSGAKISAFALQSVIDFELHDLPQIPIPKTFRSKDLIPYLLPPPECLLRGAKCYSGLLALHRRNYRTGL